MSIYLITLSTKKLIMICFNCKTYWFLTEKRFCCFLNRASKGWFSSQSPDTVKSIIEA